MSPPPPRSQQVPGDESPQSKKVSTERTTKGLRRSNSFNSLDLHCGLGADGSFEGRLKLQFEDIPNNNFGPPVGSSPRTTDASLKDFSSGAGSIDSREDSPRSQQDKSTFSIVSSLSYRSQTELPLTQQGFYSKAENFEYFKTCAHSWYYLTPESRLEPEAKKVFRLVFQAAAQLGVYNRLGSRIAWQQMLWIIGAYWGLTEAPWPYDEFDMPDMPYIFEMHSVLPRLQAEVREMQNLRSSTPSSNLNTQTLNVSDFIRPISSPPNQSPYRDPSPLSSTGSRNLSDTVTHEKIIKETEDIISREGPQPTTYSQNYQSSLEDDTPPVLPSPQSNAVKANVYKDIRKNVAFPKPCTVGNSRNSKLY